MARLLLAAEMKSAAASSGHRSANHRQREFCIRNIVQIHTQLFYYNYNFEFYSWTSYCKSIETKGFRFLILLLSFTTTKSPKMYQRIDETKYLHFADHFRRYILIILQAKLINSRNYCSDVHASLFLLFSMNSWKLLHVYIRCTSWVEKVYKDETTCIKLFK